MATLKTLFNGILVGASGYALFCLDASQNKCAFAAFAFGLCHGLLGLIESFKGSEECTVVKRISNCIMDIVPLPLINMQLSTNESIMWAHGLFIIPLTFDLITKLFTEDGQDSSTDTLKDLTMLGNIVSLTFLAVNEGNMMYGGMAFSAFYSKYGAMLSESMYEGTGEYHMLSGNALLFYLTTEAIGGK